MHKCFKIEKEFAFFVQEALARPPGGLTAMYVPKRKRRNRAQFVQLVIERQSESGIFPNGIALGARLFTLKSSPVSIQVLSYGEITPNTWRLL